MESVLIEASSAGHHNDFLLNAVMETIKRNPPQFVATIKRLRAAQAQGCVVDVVQLRKTHVVASITDAIKRVRRDFSRSAEWCVVQADGRRILEVVETQRHNRWTRRRHKNGTEQTRLRVTAIMLTLGARLGAPAELVEMVVEDMDEARFSKLHHEWHKKTTLAAVIDPAICDTTRCQRECLRHCPPVRAGFEIKSSRRQGLVISAENCIGCRICERKCPLGAIKLMQVPKW